MKRVVIPEYMTNWTDQVLADALQNQLHELHTLVRATERAADAIAAITAEMQHRQPFSS